MISYSPIIAICLGVSLCFAQPIKLSGIVKDTANVGISGATIIIENTDLRTTSRSDGSFTLPFTPTAAQQNENKRLPAKNSVVIEKGKVAITLSSDMPVTINGYDVGGRKVYHTKEMYNPGEHRLSLPQMSRGVYLYRLTIDKTSFLIKSSPSGIFNTKQTTISPGGSTLAKQIITPTQSYIISVTKSGHINYRSTLKSSISSGIVIRMLPSAGDLRDADNNIYQTVRIGNQVWTVENLKTTKYNDGTPISPGDESNEEYTSGALKTFNPGICWFKTDDLDIKAEYGGFYSWHAVKTGKLAPKGWRVPSDKDWDALQKYLIASGYNSDWTKTENKIAKSMAAQTNWQLSGLIGIDSYKNNLSGFAALPAGFVFVKNSYVRENLSTYFWSTSECNDSTAFSYCIHYHNEQLVTISSLKRNGLSVRLVQN